MFLCYLILNFQIYVFKFFFSSKIWAHRVNSIEKYEEARDLFSGVELDLVFNDLNNSFDVNHPPAKIINLNLFPMECKKCFFVEQSEEETFHFTR